MQDPLGLNTTIASYCNDTKYQIELGIETLD